MPNRLSRQNCLSLRPCCHSFCLSSCFRLVCRRKMSWIGARKCGFLFFPVFFPFFFRFAKGATTPGQKKCRRRLCRNDSIKTTTKTRNTNNDGTLTYCVCKNYCTTLLPTYLCIMYKPTYYTTTLRYCYYYYYYYYYLVLLIPLSPIFIRALSSSSLRNRNCHLT